jgi:hypothetical protein
MGTQPEQTTASGAPQVVVGRNAVDEELSCAASDVRTATAAEFTLANSEPWNQHVQRAQDVRVHRELILNTLLVNYGHGCSDL